MAGVIMAGDLTASKSARYCNSEKAGELNVQGNKKIWHFIR